MGPDAGAIADCGAVHGTLRSLPMLRRWLYGADAIDPVIDWMRINATLAGFPPQPRLP